jgi:hypothetical protein
MSTNRVPIYVGCRRVAFLGSEMELLGFEHSADLTEDEEDALWTRLHAVLDSLASYVPSSVAHGPLTAQGSSSGGSMYS